MGTNENDNKSDYEKIADATRGMFQDAIDVSKLLTEQKGSDLLANQDLPSYQIERLEKSGAVRVEKTHGKESIIKLNR